MVKDDWPLKMTDQEHEPRKQLTMEDTATRKTYYPRG